MGDNILILADDKSYLSNILSKVNVFRRCESVLCLPLGRVKSLSLNDFQIILVNSDDYPKEKLFKFLDAVKREALNTPVLFISSQVEEERLNEFYSRGMYDCLSANLSVTEYEIKLLNCLKYVELYNINDILNAFVDVTNSKTPRTDLYTHKSLKEAFDLLGENEFFKNSVYVVLTIDESTKTKVSMNRLSQILKKYLRKTDIVAQGSGKFYLLLPDTNLSGAKIAIDKIASLMGSDHMLHAGICQTALKSIDETEKMANGALKSAILNNELCVSLGENYSSDENWVGSNEKDKPFKLFRISYEKKLESIIEPLFYRLANEFSAKSPMISVCQYANNIECMFSLSYQSFRSEFLMRYNGFTKLNVNIIHKGLDTPDNSDFEIPLKKLDDDYLLSILDKFYSDFLNVISAN